LLPPLSSLVERLPHGDDLVIGPPEERARLATVLGATTISCPRPALGDGWHVETGHDLTGPQLVADALMEIAVN